MTDLIARLEAATEGSRELDAEIDASLRIGKSNLPAWAWTNFPKWRARPDGRVEVAHNDGRGGLHWQPHPFTTSLDAALTLLPEGAEYTISTLYGVADVELPLNGDDSNPPHHVRRVDGNVILALCIAALKATFARERAAG